MSAEEKAARKEKSDHRKDIRLVFKTAGFHRVTGVAEKTLRDGPHTTDLDDLFTYENVLVVAEYTCAQSSSIGDHLKKKKLFFDKIAAQPAEFLKLLRQQFPDSASQLSATYHDSQVRLVIVYCSRHDFDSHYKDQVPGPVYFDYPAVRYFVAVAKAIKRSMTAEFLNFLRLPSDCVGRDGKISIASRTLEFGGSVLPEAHSHFEDGFKVVSFYADAESLLRTSYVLRKDGWRDSLGLYQRMISSSKILGMRVYLKKKKRVFVNNIIVTLPDSARTVDKSGRTIEVTTLNTTESVRLQLPDAPNTIGIIDGQHRVFAYHESAPDDPDIAGLRKQQNLLVTGIIFPSGLSQPEKEKFEARLFVEINSTQTRASSRLKQAIGLITEPFSTESIATRVLENLAKSGPLAGYVSRYFFDKGKLKTASIVSFGLKPVVKTSGIDSLFAIWDDPRKSELEKGENPAALDDYISYCASIVNSLLIAVKLNLPKTRWTTDPRVEDRVLTTTSVNALLIVLRRLIGMGKDVTLDGLTENLADIDKIDFRSYRSSQYARLADDIVKEFYGDPEPQ